MGSLIHYVNTADALERPLRVTCVTARSVSGSGCGAKLETVIAFSTFNKPPRSKSRPLAAHKTKWNDCITEPQGYAIAKTKLMVHSCKYIVAHAYPLARSDRRKPQRSKMSTPTAHLIPYFFTMPRKTKRTQQLEISLCDSVSAE